jgi:hypothetical protein
MLHFLLVADDDDDEEEEKVNSPFLNLHPREPLSRL